MCHTRYMRAAIKLSVLDGAILRNLTLVKLNKGMQVDTLVPQAMKDAPSCEKRRVAAKKR